MGTIIDLTVGGLEVDWSKNYKGIDHGDLFQEQDREPDGEFRRPLRTIVPAWSFSAIA